MKKYIIEWIENSEEYQNEVDVFHSKFYSRKSAEEYQRILKKDKNVIYSEIIEIKKEINNKNGI